MNCCCQCYVIKCQRIKQPSIKNTILHYVYRVQVLMFYLMMWQTATVHTQDLIQLRFQTRYQHEKFQRIHPTLCMSTCESKDHYLRSQFLMCVNSWNCSSSRVDIKNNYSIMYCHFKWFKLKCICVYKPTRCNTSYE